MTASKQEIKICLPFLGKQSLKLRTNLTKLVNKYYPHCTLRVIFNSNNRLRNAFSFKDKIPLSVRSHLIYRFTCNSCNAVYIGKTRRHYLVRIFEHLGISLVTHKKFTYNPNNNNNTAVLNHLNCTPCNSTQKDFSIIGSARTDALLCIKESLLVHKNKPKLNTSERSTPVYLFN